MKKKELRLQLLMNLVPLAGVILADWSVFALFYAYWLETLAVTFFNSIKITTAKKSDSPPPHLMKAIKYFGFNIFLLLFYMVFILVFVGLDIARKQDGVNFAKYLLLIDSSFRYAMLTLLMAKTAAFIAEYFFSNQYKKASPDDYNSYFNARLIIIHVVIVLGVFAHMFAANNFGDKMGVVAFAIVFVLAKSIGDIVSYFFKPEEQGSF